MIFLSTLMQLWIEIAHSSFFTSSLFNNSRISFDLITSACGMMTLSDHSLHVES
jgi:hypothetical protein